MKKAVSITVLIGYILVVCTFLSLKIEHTMMTQAVTVTLDAVTQNTVSGSALFRDERGEHLYYVEEGLGWEDGLRVREFREDLYTYDPVTNTIELSMYYNWEIITTASRQPQPGEKINLLANRETGTDSYLLLYPDGVPETIADISGVSITALGSHAVIVEVRNAKMPFIEHEAKNALAAYQQEGWRVYSLKDIDKLSGYLPSLILSSILLLIPVILLLLQCVMKQATPKTLGVFVIIALLMMGVAFVCIYSMDFPSSLLPNKNVFDLKHYAHLYSEIQSGLPKLK